MHRKGIVTGKYSRICMLRSIGRFDKILKLDSSVSSCEFIHIVKDIYMPDLIASLKCKTGDMMEAIKDSYGFFFFDMYPPTFFVFSD